MAYVSRNSAGAVNGVCAYPNPDATELLADDNAEIIAFLHPGPTPTDVDVERDRRISLGFTFNGVKYQTRMDKDDFTNISGMGALGVNAVMSGSVAGDLRWFDANNDFTWIAENNSKVPMDARTMIAFGQAAAKWKSAHVFTANAIKTMSPIPTNFTADAYWSQIVSVY